MDVSDISGDVEGMMDHELWNQIMLVKPIPITDDELFHGESERFRVDIEDDHKAIKHCFSTDDVEECKQRLGEVKEEWSTQALNQMNQTNPQLLSTWFKLTKVAVTEPVDVVFRAEERPVACMATPGWPS